MQQKGCEMAKVQCLRCGEERDGLDSPPFNNDLGQKIFENSCAECWKAWVSQQLMLMNEYRLDPMNDEHSAYLDREMIKFLGLN